MHDHLVVQVSEIDGTVYASVPRERMWSLVEFLSCQRVRVSYSYHPNYFTVTFINMSVPSAQQIVDDWTHAEKVPAKHADQRLLGHL